MDAAAEAACTGYGEPPPEPSASRHDPSTRDVAPRPPPQLPPVHPRKGQWSMGATARVAPVVDHSPSGQEVDDDDGEQAPAAGAPHMPQLLGLGLDGQKGRLV